MEIEPVHRLLDVEIIGTGFRLDFEPGRELPCRADGRWRMADCQRGISTGIAQLIEWNKAHSNDYVLL